MADERTIAPGPSRWRRAWAAGLRPSARWLWPAAAFGVLALGLDGLRGASPGALGLELRPGAVTPGAWLEVVAGWLAAGFGLAGLLVLALAVVSRRLGIVSAVERRRLGAAADRPVVLGRLLLCAAVGAGLLLALAGVVAGAARGADGSEAAVLALWLSWAQRASATLALGLGLGAAVELGLDRRERGARLRQSPQQVRDEARAAGGA